MPDIGIITEAPAWYLLLCISAGLAFAALLYYREKRSELPGGLKKFLALLRFVAITLISFLLLSPLIRSNIEEKEKPLIIIAADNSHSVMLGPDSSQYMDDFPAQLDNLSDRLGQDYSIEKYLVGEEVTHLDGGSSFKNTLDYSDKQTDVSALFTSVRDLYSNRNVGAVIFAGDGIYNKGVNPLYEQQQLDLPVYTVALGDTAMRKDVVLSHVRYNRLAYLNNDFPVRVILGASMAEGEEVEISISRDGSRVASESVKIDNPSFSRPVDFLLKADRTGLQRFRVAVRALPEEPNVENNIKDIFIDVLDSRSRILILGSAPHPDITALKEAIGKNMNYEVEVSLGRDFTGSLEPYNLVILHQIPSREFPGTEIREAMVAKKIPFLIIAGQRTDMQAWNVWRTGLEVQVTPGNYEEALAEPSEDFSLFSLDEKTAEIIRSMPPLVAPFGNYITSNAVQVLFYQRIGSVETSRPMVAFASDGAYRWGYVLGDGLWKWRLMNYALNFDHSAFDGLIQKIVQYLAIREERGQFRIFHESRFNENEAVRFEAEVYNDSYELITEPDVEIRVRDEDGNEYPLTFSRLDRGYVLNAGKYPPGKYEYNAAVTTGGRSLSSSGEFYVIPVDVEALRMVADHNLLRTISQRSGGSLVYPGEITELVNLIQQRQDIKPVVYEQKKFRELVSLISLLFLVLLLLSTEWFLRKRGGSY